MGMQLEEGIIDNPEDRQPMAVRSVDPLDILRGSQDGTTQGHLALADLDAIAAKNDKSLGSQSVIAE